MPDPTQQPQQQEKPVDPLEWWQGESSPLSDIDRADPQTKKWENDFFNEFAQGFHQQEFNNLGQYEKWLRSRNTSFKEIRGFMRTTGMKYMPRRIKEEYEQSLAIRKMEDQFRRTIDMQGQMASKIQDAIKAGDLPDGVYFDPKTMGLNFKAPKKSDPAKERNQIISQLGKLRQYKEKADIEGAEEESAIYAEEIVGLVQQLRSAGQEGQGGGQQQELSPQDAEAYQWVQDHPNDPRSASIMQMLQQTYQPQQ